MPSLRTHRHDRAGHRRGLRGRLGRRSGQRLEAASTYLRGHDLRGLLDDLERMVDRRPTQSLLVAVGAGWLVGKLLR
jgi:hypothetical protein